MKMIVNEALIANLPSIAKLTDNQVRSAPDSTTTAFYTVLGYIDLSSYKVVSCTKLKV